MSEAALEALRRGDAEALGRLLDERPELRALVEQVLAQDPRPATHKACNRADGVDVDRAYGTALADVDVRWRVRDGAVWVLQVSAPAEDRRTPS